MAIEDSMTRPDDHRAEAERLLRMIQQPTREYLDSLNDDPAALDRDIALAQVHATLAASAAIRPTHAHSGDEIVYDGIGRTELERLRALLSHPDRDSLTTWEVVEIAADDLARARQAVSA